MFSILTTFGAASDENFAKWRHLRLSDVPLRCPAVTMIPSPLPGVLVNIFGEHRDWKHFMGTSGLGNTLRVMGNIGTGEHRNWGISLGNIGTGNTSEEHRDWGKRDWETYVLGNTSGGYRDCEHCDWGSTFVEHMDSKAPLGNKMTGKHLRETKGVEIILWNTGTGEQRLWNIFGEHRDGKPLLGSIGIGEESGLRT